MSTPTKERAEQLANMVEKRRQAIESMLMDIKEQRGEQSKAIIELFMTQDKVAADVTRAQARLQSAAARVDQADGACHTGDRTCFDADVLLADG